MEHWVDSLPKGEHLGSVVHLGTMCIGAPFQIPVVKFLGAHVEIVHLSYGFHLPLR